MSTKKKKGQNRKKEALKAKLKQTGLKQEIKNSSDYKKIIKQSNSEENLSPPKNYLNKEILKTLFISIILISSIIILKIINPF